MVQHFTQIERVDHNAVLRKIQGASPLKALGIMQQVPALDRPLCVRGLSDEGMAQVAARQIAASSSSENSVVSELLDGRLYWMELPGASSTLLRSMKGVV
ncbi:hypothetical protein [Thermoleptolyngbya sp. C42_A2020_037]|uniref:hypothetical protein n=1 Tax=Thermoleptolyngbya sp. C42_A2020_037 TaxID=2747799 RepID=UPI0019E813F8|nr:hypothetical protein [Thermoleptolyngbya sp. C42_A2020_037]MBF2084775.1 hypothetical protein [Thermoleptolyngbya sp. C42_A2020_037]